MTTVRISHRLCELCGKQLEDNQRGRFCSQSCINRARYLESEIERLAAAGSVTVPKHEGSS